MPEKREAAGTELANVIAALAARIEELERSKVDVTRIASEPGNKHKTANAT